jgi:hypothetical protein
MKTVSEKIAIRERLRIIELIKNWLNPGTNFLNTPTTDETLDEAKLLIYEIKYCSNIEVTEKEKEEVKEIAIRLHMRENS